MFDKIYSELLEYYSGIAKLDAENPSNFRILNINTFKDEPTKKKRKRRNSMLQRGKVPGSKRHRKRKDTNKRR
jgi:hypothetical protein